MSRKNQMLEPEFWKATGRYSKRAIRVASAEAKEALSIPLPESKDKEE